MQEGPTMCGKVRIVSLAIVLCVAAALAACDLGVTERSTEGSPREITAEDPLTGSEALFGGVNCDKVTTYVCPDGTCLCRQQNCDLVWHNGDYAPCSGPPAPGCDHDLGSQICFPTGQPIQCTADNIPVGRCSIGCISGDVTCSSEGACCRCERPCYPRVRSPQS